MGTIDATEQLLAAKDAEIAQWAGLYLNLSRLILRIPIESRPAQLHMHVESAARLQEMARNLVNEFTSSY